MSLLEWVDPHSVTEEDWEWLTKVDFAGPAYDRMQRKTVQSALIDGRMHLFRFNNGGVLLTETPVNDSGIKRLTLLRAAGEGLGWTMAKLAVAVKQLAREWGCEAVETMVYSQRWAEAMKAVGAKPEAVKMVLEI